MDIHGPEVLFTPSEAHWIQVMGQYYPSMASLAQRVFCARLSYMNGCLGLNANHSSTSTPLPAAGNTDTSYLSDMQLIQDTEASFATDREGVEAAVIKVEMDDKEKQTLLIRARMDSKVTVDDPELAERNAGPNLTPDQEWGNIVILSEAIGFDQAFEVNALDYNPSYVAASDEYDRVRSLGEMNEQAVMRGIVTALAADLGNAE